MNNAFDKWNDLKERFPQENMIHISDRQEMIYSFIQGSNNDEQNHEGSKSKVQSQQIGGFTLEQYQTFLSLLKLSKSSDNVSNQVFVIPSNITTQISNKFFSSFNSWILDNGVTNHICSSLTHFTSYLQINHIYVKLPNGNQVNYYGSIFFNQNNVIYNVLYISCFIFNFLSITKLIDNLSCVLTFDSNGCHI